MLIRVGISGELIYPEQSSFVLHQRPDLTSWGYVGSARRLCRVELVSEH